MHGVMKYINDSLKLGTIVEQRIKERDLKQLESAKMDLMERMGTSVGLHTAGVPFISSALLSVVSFAMPQLTLWGAIFQWFSWPAHAVFAGIIPHRFTLLSADLPVDDAVLSRFSGCA
ncbi:Uncharacterised protein [Klebsiella aerogenes]|nr:Uncharacterised protein [Klebsiella aerogenes]